MTPCGQGFDVVRQITPSEPQSSCSQSGKPADEAALRKCSMPSERHEVPSEHVLGRSHRSARNWKWAKERRVRGAGESLLLGARRWLPSRAEYPGAAAETRRARRCSSGRRSTARAAVGQPTGGAAPSRRRPAFRGPLRRDRPRAAAISTTLSPPPWTPGAGRGARPGPDRLKVDSPRQI